MEEREELIKKVLAVATDILNEKIGLAEGVQELKPFLTDLKIDMDKEFITIMAVDSETDEFPIGSVRKYWNPEKLKELDGERIKFEKFYKNDVFEACRKLVEKFKQ